MEHYRAVSGVPHSSGFCISPLLGNWLMALVPSEMLITREPLVLSAGPGPHRIKDQGLFAFI